MTAPDLVASPELLKLLEQGFLKHAEEFETSMALAVDEESVHKDMLANRIVPIDMASPARGKYFARDAITHPASTGRVMIAEFFSEISRGGIIGNPYLASKEKPRTPQIRAARKSGRLSRHPCLGRPRRGAMPSGEALKCGVPCSAPPTGG